MKKSENGYYRGTINLGRDENGKYIRKQVYAKTKAELDAKMTELKSQLNQGLNITNDDITMEQMMTIWKNIRLQNKSNAYIKNCELLLKHLEPIKYMKLKSIKPMMIQEIINKLVTEQKFNTAHKLLQIIKSIFKMAVANDYIVKNPAENISFTKYQKEEKKALSKNEQDVILNSNHKHSDFFKVLLLTGMRKGEISALTYNDIDFEKNVINVSKACDFSTNNPTIKPTKNGKSRTIPLLNKTAEILKSRLNDRQSIYVFHKADGGILSDTAIKRMLESFLKDTKLDFTLHQLRHTFCTLLFYSGVSSKKAQMIMGHSSLTITMNIYTHLAEEMEDDTAEILNKFI